MPEVQSGVGQEVGARESGAGSEGEDRPAAQEEGTGAISEEQRLLISAFWDAEEEIVRAKRHRSRMVTALLDTGMTMRGAAPYLGLSRGRICQLRQEYEASLGSER